MALETLNDIVVTKGGWPALWERGGATTRRGSAVVITKTGRGEAPSGFGEDPRSPRLRAARSRRLAGRHVCHLRRTFRRSQYQAHQARGSPGSGGPG